MTVGAHKGRNGKNIEKHRAKNKNKSKNKSKQTKKKKNTRKFIKVPRQKIQNITLSKMVLVEVKVA